PHQLGVVGERRPGPLQRLGRELTCGVDTLTQPHDPHLAMHVAQPAARAGPVGDEQPARVGAAVDGGDPAYRRIHVSRSTIPSIAGSSASIANASSPSGLTPGPFASECAISTCRHLTRSGMPPPEN